MTLGKPTLKVIVMTALTLTNLSKIYLRKNKPDFHAVKDLNFTADKGEMIAFLSPNGAGKSTTIKMLCGILTPTSGSAKILGADAGSIEANKQLGLVFGTRSQLHLPLIA